MELFRNARLKIGNSILVKKVARVNRRVYYSNIDQVRTIGIIWDASRTEDFISLTKFFHKMQERGIDVKIIAYFPGKELPDQYTAQRFLTCIRKNETSLFYLPVSRDAEFFIKNRFDVLIDINFKSELPLSYITSLSAAGFKVGLFDSYQGASTFDLMMELKKPVQIDNYLNEILRYLEMINSGSAVQAVK
ncbi:MAG: hypothetical protein ABSA76_11495 [Bacteroidales bacterium]